MDRSGEDELHASSSCCLVAIGRLQVNTVCFHTIVENVRPEVPNSIFSRIYI